MKESPFIALVVFPALLFFVGGIAWFVASELYTPVNRVGAYLVMGAAGLPIALVYTGVAWLLMRKGEHCGRRTNAVFLFALGGFIPLTLGAGIGLNGLLDSGTPKTHELPILNSYTVELSHTPDGRYIQKNNRPRGDVIIARPWRKGQSAVILAPDTLSLDKLRNGELTTARLTVKPGALGFEWIQDKEFY